MLKSVFCCVLVMLCGLAVTTQTSININTTTTITFNNSNNNYTSEVLLKNHDHDQDGVLDFGEFVNLIRSVFLQRMTSSRSRHYITEARMRKLFIQVDLQSDGKVDGTEFDKFWRHCLQPLLRPYPVLLVLNAQRDFLSPTGSLYIHHTEHLVPLVNSLSATGLFRQRYFVRDYHPANHISFAGFKTNGLSLDDDVDGNYTAHNRIRFAEDQRISWRPHCVQGTVGSHFAHGLNIHGYDYISPSTVFAKGTEVNVDALSALRDLNATPLPLFYELEQLQQIHGPFLLVITGVALEYDIVQTALDAVATNWPVLVLEDGIGSFEPLDGVAMQQVRLILRKNNVPLLSTQHALQVVRAHRRAIEHLFTLANGFYKRFGVRHSFTRETRGLTR